MPEYVCAPGIAWSVEQYGILIAGEREVQLRFPEAAVWDWIARGGSVEGTAEKTAACMRITGPQAAQLVSRCIGEWVAAGLLKGRDG